MARFAEAVNDDPQPTGKSIVIDHKGAEWAYWLGADMHACTPGDNPFRRQSPHWYFWRQGQQGQPFAYPMATPYASIQL